MKFNLINISIFLFALDFLLLILLGKTYTKFLVISPYFYGHDIVLLLASLIPLINYNKYKNRIKSIEILFFLAFIYLIISLFNKEFEIDNKWYYVFRQFMIFGYAMIVYVIVKHLYPIKKESYYFIISIGLFGFLCLAVQILFVIYYYFSKGQHPLFERNYYSPIIIMGLFVFASYALTQVKNPYLKLLFSAFNFFIALSTGHDSVYLSLVIIYFSYFFLIGTKRIRIILLIALLSIIVLVMIYIPSFTDVNMQWRVMFWKDCLRRLSNNFFIFGEGFAVPYASSETVVELNDLMLSHGHNIEITGDEKFLSAPHNSFLSMFIHLGILPILLLLYPIIKPLCYKGFVKDKEYIFLFVSLIGMSVFCFFNVILELPHSSSIFWVVYFVLIMKSNK